MSLAKQYISELKKSDGILKENTHEASYENISGSLYGFLLSLRQKHPESKENIEHWLLLIDENLQELDNLATADMENGQDAIDTVLGNLRSLLKH